MSEMATFHRRAAGETCAVTGCSHGRTFEPAAIRGDAGPDRATADTDGIDRWWAGWVAELSTPGWGKERYCKSGLESGAIPGWTSADRRTLALQVKIVSTTSVRAKWAYNPYRFEVKKEIPVHTFETRANDSTVRAGSRNFNGLKRTNGQSEYATASHEILPFRPGSGEPSNVGARSSGSDTTALTEGMEVQP